MHYRLIIFLLLIVPLVTKAQKNQELNGFIINAITQSAVGNVTIKNTSSNKGTTSDNNGYFTISYTTGDTLEFSSMGYSARAISDIESITTAPNTLTVELSPKSYTIEQVDVDEFVTKEEDFRSNIYQEEPGIGEALFSPTTYLYYKTSKKEKQKRKMREAFVYDQQMAHIYKIYNIELVKEFSGLNGDELLKCFEYCNANIQLQPNDNEASINGKLIEVLSEYFKGNKK